MRLLLVEDDTTLSEQMRSRLAQSGFAVDCAHNGVDAEHLGDQEAYDLVILDLGLPRRPGLEVLRNWRSHGNGVPVIVLTARDAWYERVEGLKAGADDYIGKPFHMEELLARIQALIRRRKALSAPQLRVQSYRLDEERQVLVADNGGELPLTGTEFRLLRYFLLHPGKVLSKGELTEHVYAYDADKDSNVIEVYINRLRQKLGKEVLKTRRGQGYVLEPGD